MKAADIENVTMNKMNTIIPYAYNSHASPLGVNHNERTPVIVIIIPMTIMGTYRVCPDVNTKKSLNVCNP